jgi:integrase
MKLDAKSVAALKLGDKTDAIHFDDAMPGFGFRLRLAGGRLRRSWLVQYKRAGATRRITLGSAEVLGSEAARAAAKKLLAKVALGEDPQAERTDRRGRDRLTLASQVEGYLTVKQPELATRSFTAMRRYLSDPRYFGPLHRLALDTITRKDVAARVVAIMRECGNPTAARARSVLSGFFTWSMRMGLVESNPVIGTVTPTEGGGRDRVLTDAELAAIWRACGDNDFGRIIRLLTLGAWRRAEIGDMRWSELDGGTFTVPAARSKNGRAHALPLTPTMARIIAQVPQMATRDQLFGQRSHGFTRWHQAKAELDARCGVIGWNIHDLRRTCATRMADLGIAPHVIEQILNHRSGHRAGPAGIYNRSVYAAEVRTALLLWDDHVQALVTGDKRKILNVAKFNLAGQRATG